MIWVVGALATLLAVQSLVLCRTMRLCRTAADGWHRALEGEREAIAEWRVTHDRWVEQVARYEVLAEYMSEDAP